MSIEKLKSNKFLRSVLLVAGGAAIAQGVTVGVTPVLTRLFTPEEFGILAAFTSALTMLLAISSLRYEFALPQAKNKKQAEALVYLCLGLLLVTSLTVFVLLVVASLSGLLLRGGWGFIWLLPIGVLFAGAFQVANYWTIREKAFAELAKANVNRSLFQACAQVGMGWVGIGGIALVLGYVLSQAVGAIKILLAVTRKTRPPSWRRLKTIATRHKKFPFFSVPAGVLNVSALHLTPFLLIYLYGAASAGFFSLAQRAMGAPMAFLGMAIANVYLSELPRLKESEPKRLMSFYLRSCRNLLALGLPIVGLATFVLWWGVDLIFGAEWSRAAEFVVYLAPFFIGQFVVAPLSQTLNVLERQDIQLLWDAIRLIVPNSILILSFWGGSEDKTALGLYSGSMLMVYILNVVLTVLSIRSYARGEKI